ncbi:MAG: methyltransferase domain-containing protein [Saprospiraceae bacterium]
MTSSASSYDQCAYPSYPYPQTHPDRLATIAALFGLNPPDVERCRVLELGCAGGGNLLPMAEQLPGSTFVGIDNSAKQIEQAVQATKALGLTNIDFRTLDLREIDDGFGEFDYIICHGLYTWVPKELQPKIIAICRRHLAANGVAFISYNTLPGWLNVSRPLKNGAALALPSGEDDNRWKNSGWINHPAQESQQGRRTTPRIASVSVLKHQAGERAV